MGNYQSHSGEAATSDSNRKLERLKLPDLTGKRFLDIGCNQGYFCNAAAERGASYVLGIDADSEAIEFASKTYAKQNVEFRVQRWSALPQENFDVVLWASAMHYESDPSNIIRNVTSILSPSGLLILECGVVTDRWNKTMIPIARPNDTRLYPTIRYLLEEVLDGMSVRWVSQPETTRWDAVPRSVFHCRPHSTFVVLIRGNAGHGKTTLARLMQPGASKNIGIDEFIGRIAKGPYFSNGIQQFIRDNVDMLDLQTFIPSIDTAGLTRDYISLLAASVGRSDRMVVIEGLITDRQVDELKAHVDPGVMIWDMRRLS
jgi:methyltransferase family protein